MTENPRSRPRRGVLGYAAELQQFDPVPPHVDELSRSVRATRRLPAPPPEPSPPPAAAAPIVSHIRQQPSRRSAAMIVGAAGLILAGAAVGYAGFGGPAGSPPARIPDAAAPSRPADPAPIDPAVPGAEPLAGRTTEPVTAITAAAGVTATETSPDAPPGPTVPAPLDATPVATPAPTEPARPDPAGPPPTEPAAAPAPPLTAAFSHVVDTAGDGLLGYAGTVRILNPGPRDVTGWQVTLTVPGGNPVTATGASVAQDGETVTFTPAGEAGVPAGGAVTFTFTVEGLLAALPGGCALDGRPCS